MPLEKIYEEIPAKQVPPDIAYVKVSKRTYQLIKRVNDGKGWNMGLTGLTQWVPMTDDDDKPLKPMSYSDLMQWLSNASKQWPEVPYKICTGATYRL